MINILMVTRPEGSRGPSNAYRNHFNAIQNSNKYNIFEINQFEKIEELAHIDIFWFSVRFHPNLYFALKNFFPNKKFVMGPNVLFEKAEIGPSDQWEKWFVENVEADYYFNKADFYLERAKQFYKKSKNYNVLRNCIEVDSHKNTSLSKDIDVLLYYKNRRIDNQLDDLFPAFMKEFKNLGLKYETIKYGEYQREEYFNLLDRSKLCVWFSIEDFCANAQLESQYFNVPVIGTKHNCTENFDNSLVVDASEILENSWVRWKEDMPKTYLDRIVHFFDKDVSLIENKPKSFVEQNFSYSAYEKQLDRIFN